MEHQHFASAKIALFHSETILTYLRDDFATIPWPGKWDLPGGGRKGAETPLECVLRELHEEFGISLAPARIVWSRSYPSWAQDGLLTFYFAAPLTQDDIDGIVFSDEGQHWRMMAVAEFLSHPDGIPHQQQSVRDYLEGRGQ